MAWVKYVNEISNQEINDIIATAQKIRKTHNTLVLCGIGGSYLGARAAIEALDGIKGRYDMEIIYFGNTLSAHYINRTLKYLKGRDFAVNVISKSGTTLESSLGFRLLKKALVQKYGLDNAKKRIYVTTDKKDGLLRKETEINQYKSFVIPRNIGGRYSVLTSVGLFPLAVMGLDIERILAGARKAFTDLSSPLILENEAYRYAITRANLAKNHQIELLVLYEPQLMMFGEWWKQLYGESEGKDGKGLFPAVSINPTDLHSLGQFIQEGSKVLFETTLNLMPIGKEVVVSEEENNFDDLNYLKNQTLGNLSQMVLNSTVKAHFEKGKINNLILNINRYDEFSIGYLFYFFMRSCAVSAYLQGVDPFVQDGVEIYKQNLKDMLIEK